MTAERRCLPLTVNASTVPAPFRRLAPPLWIPVTPVITADGCDDWDDENDGAEARQQWRPVLLLTGLDHGFTGLSWTLPGHRQLAHQRIRVHSQCRLE